MRNGNGSKVMYCGDVISGVVVVLVVLVVLVVVVMVVVLSWW